jgi:hypothetical protein
MVFAEKHKMRPRSYERPHISPPDLPPASKRIVQPEYMRAEAEAVEQFGVRHRDANLAARAACCLFERAPFYAKLMARRRDRVEHANIVAALRKRLSELKERAFRPAHRSGAQRFA